MGAQTAMAASVTPRPTLFPIFFALRLPVHQGKPKTDGVLINYDVVFL